MKFLFKNTDNLFMLKMNKKCVYKNQHGINILNKDTKEYDVLMKIFLGEEISQGEFVENRRMLKSLLRNNYLIKVPDCINEEHKLYKTFQYLFATNKISNLSQIIKFQNKKALIVGLGGIALEVIQQLVSLDFINYVLVDFDIINQTNLNRQFLFQKKDIGKYKIDVVEHYIKENVVDASITKYKLKINSSEDMRRIISDNNNIDIVLCCADFPPIDIELFILEELMGSKIAYLGAGVGIYKGVVGPLLTKDKTRLQYIEQLRKNKNTLDVLTNCSASYGITNTIISTLMANQCIDYLLESHPITLNKSLIYYFENHKVEFYDI